MSPDSAMPPDMSVVVVTRDTYATIRRVVRHLRAQTIRDRIELIIVCPLGRALDAVPEGELSGFRAYRVVEVGPIERRGRAAASGVRHATAPVVALIENHSFPDPGWAEALLAAHGGPWAAVAPSIRNANPERLWSWASFFMVYGDEAVPAAPGERTRLPWHNTAYKRSALMTYDNRLPDLLDAEATLQEDLRRRGLRLFLEPAAVTSHVNPAAVRLALRLRFARGRIFGAARSRGWSTARRLAYVAGAPIIPFVNLPPLARNVWRNPEGHRRLLRLLPLMMLYLTAAAVGEAVGYLFGEGGERDFVEDLEFLIEERLGGVPLRPAT